MGGENRHEKNAIVHNFWPYNFGDMNNGDGAVLRPLKQPYIERDEGNMLRSYGKICCAGDERTGGQPSKSSGNFHLASLTPL